MEFQISPLLLFLDTSSLLLALQNFNYYIIYVTASQDLKIDSSDWSFLNIQGTAPASAFNMKYLLIVLPKKKGQNRWMKNSICNVNSILQNRMCVIYLWQYSGETPIFSIPVQVHRLFAQLSRFLNKAYLLKSKHLTY